MTIRDIALRPFEETQQAIEALEAECENDLACGKKTYPANCIRLDLARLQRDVQILAMGMQEMGEGLAMFAVIEEKQRFLLSGVAVLMEAVAILLQLANASAPGI